MTQPISWLQEVSVSHQNLDSFEVLMDEIIAESEENRGMQKLEWNIAIDQGNCHILIDCRDNESALQYLTAYRVKFAKRFDDLAETRRLVVYGEPDNRVQSALPNTTEYMVTAGGFVR